MLKTIVMTASSDYYDNITLDIKKKKKIAVIRIQWVVRFWL